MTISRTEQTLSNQHCASRGLTQYFRYTANSVHLVWLLRHNRVRAKCTGSRTHKRFAMKMTKYGAVNTRCPDARPWKIPRYIFTRLYTQSQYAQGDQGKYKEYTPPFPLLVKTRAIRFCKWPAQMSDTGNNNQYGKKWQLSTLCGCLIYKTSFDNKMEKWEYSIDLDDHFAYECILDGKYGCGAQNKLVVHFSFMFFFTLWGKLCHPSITDQKCFSNAKPVNKLLVIFFIIAVRK